MKCKSGGTPAKINDPCKKKRREVGGGHLTGSRAFQDQGDEVEWVGAE